MIGFPNSSTMALAIALSGILIPTVFFFLKTLGNDLLPSSIKV